MTVSCHRGGTINSEMKEIEQYSSSIDSAIDSGNVERYSQLIKEFYNDSQEDHSNLFRVYAASYYGQLLIMGGQLDQGKAILDEALKFSADFPEDTIWSVIYNGYGLYYQAVKNQNFFAAIECYLKAIDFARQCNDKHVLASIMSSLAMLKNAVEDTTGLKYALEAYQTAEKTGDNNILTYAATNVIRQMLLRKDTTEAEKWLNTLRKIRPSSHMPSATHIMQAEIYRIAGNYEKAMQYADLAIAIVDTAKNVLPGEKTTAYFEKALNLNALGRYEESNKWADKIYELSKREFVAIQETNMADLHAKNYEHLGDFKKAHEYRKKQSEVLEKKYKTDRYNIMKAREVALEVAEKEAEIEKQREHARMLRWTLWGTLGFCALLAILCLHIYSVYKKEQKLMEVVVERAQKDDEIEEKRESQVNDRHARLFQRIKHELNDQKMIHDANLSRESLAEHLGTNRTYISEAISMMTGMSVPQYINHLRISEAERRLRAPDDVSNFTEFGHSLGFTSLSAFQAAFKRQTGMTLSAYRDIAKKQLTSPKTE